mmetsp:Transcript_16948/g.48318  ORF Transcript_16948/g.48318 Transcript_16948/m.48318 type:complete len:117 (-) Transcript_16948:1126-1476(-)
MHLDPSILVWHRFDMTDMQMATHSLIIHISSKEGRREAHLHSQRRTDGQTDMAPLLHLLVDCVNAFGGYTHTRTHGEIRLTCAHKRPVDVMDDGKNTHTQPKQQQATRKEGHELHL